MRVQSLQVALNLATKLQKNKINDATIFISIYPLPSQHQNVTTPTQHHNFHYANSTQHQHFTMPVIFSQILKFDRDTNLLCNSQLYILAQMSLHICLTNLELLETWASQMRKIGFEVEDDVEDV